MNSKLLRSLSIDADFYELGPEDIELHKSIEKFTARLVNDVLSYDWLRKSDPVSDEFRRYAEQVARECGLCEVLYHPGFPDIRYPKNYLAYAALVVKECNSIKWFADQYGMFGRDVTTATLTHFNIKSILEDHS